MGLLDSFLGQGFDDPKSAAIMGLSQGLLSGSLGAGIGGANNAYAEAKQAALKQKLMDAQMQNYQSEIEQRKLAGIKDQRKQSILDELFPKGGPSQPAMPGQLGSGSFGAVQPPSGMPSIPPVMSPQQSLASRLNPEMLARLKVGADTDLTDIYKLMQPKWENAGGNFVNTNDPNFKGGFVPQVKMAENGQTSLMTPGPDGLPRISAPGGALETYSAFRNADEAAKARNDLVQVYNPQTRQMEFRPRSQVLQGAQPSPQMPIAQPQAAPQPQLSTAANVPPQPGMTGNFVGDPAKAMEDIMSIKDPQERANAMAAFQEQAKRTRGFAQGGAFAAGPSAGDTATAAADRTSAEQIAKDVTEQRKSIMSAAFTAPSNIAKYQQIGKLLADVDGGALTPGGTHLASLANSVGLKIDKNLPNKEAAMSLANEAALQLRSPAGGAGMPGAMSDQDRQFLASMTPNIAQSAEGRKKIIGSYVAMQQRNQQVATFARNYEKKYGKLDNGFFEQLQSWSNSNPLFGGK